MALYVQRPLIVDAVQFNGKLTPDIQKFINGFNRGITFDMDLTIGMMIITTPEKR